MTKTAGIAGAGLVGRILALELHNIGWKVSIFDQDNILGRGSCGFIAGGMLSLYSEAESIGDLVVELGCRSMELWPKILYSVGGNTHFQTLGSILVSHTKDLPELERMCLVIRRRFPDLLRDLHITDVRKFEQELTVSLGVYVKDEGNIDNVQLFRGLERVLKSAGVYWHSNTKVSKVYSGKIVANSTEHAFDFVFDCRGVGAKDEILGLRGVRGEVILLHAPEVFISRPVRMVHPRYSIYVVPRPGRKFVVGATEIESCDSSEISVQSALEMLSAAYSLHRGFREARIIGMMSGCRPAFSDNLPRVIVEDRTIRINGLYRYGYLSAPSVVEAVISLLSHDKIRYPGLFRR